MSKKSSFEFIASIGAVALLVAVLVAAWLSLGYGGGPFECRFERSRAGLPSGLVDWAACAGAR